MTTQPPQGDFPPVHPSGGDQTVFTRPDWLLRLPNFLVQLIEKIVGLVVQAITGIFLPGPIGSAFSQLANWATAILPAQILEPFQDLVDALIDLLGHIPIVGPIIAQLADMFGFLDDNTSTAQGSANNANTGVAALNAQLAAITAPAGGVSLTDNFDRSGSTLGSNWTQAYSGPGSGSLGTDGNNASWSTSGAAARTCHAAYTTTALASDTQMCSLVQSAPKNASNTDPDLRLILRSDSAVSNCVVAIIRYNAVEIGYVLSGTYTRLGAVASVTTKTGDRWELRAGIGVNNRQFQLYQNGGTTPVCDRTDSGAASQMGASFRYAGFGEQAGVNFAFGFGFLQTAPPDVQGWAAADRAA